MNRSNLMRAIRDAQTGPALFPTSFDGLHNITPEQAATIDAKIRLWLDTWIIPAMQEAVPPTRSKKG